MSFNEEMEEVNEGFRWFFKWLLPRALLVILILSVVGWGLNAAGLFGSTVVERKVFENSYQRSEGMKARIATEKAALAEIEAQLSNPELDKQTRHNLLAQRRAARVRLRTAEEMQ